VFSLFTFSIPSASKTECPTPCDSPNPTPFFSSLSRECCWHFLDIHMNKLFSKTITLCALIFLYFNFLIDDIPVTEICIYNLTIRKFKYRKIKAHKVIVSRNNLFIWISRKCQQHSRLRLEKNGVGLGESHGVGYSVLEVEGIENVKSETLVLIQWLRKKKKNQWV
jgi:hypothetical protein